jgi:hypothetical protein
MTNDGTPDQDFTVAALAIEDRLARLDYDGQNALVSRVLTQGSRRLRLRRTAQWGSAAAAVVLIAGTSWAVAANRNTSDSVLIAGPGMSASASASFGGFALAPCGGTVRTVAPAESPFTISAVVPGTVSTASGGQLRFPVTVTNTSSVTRYGRVQPPDVTLAQDGKVASAGMARTLIALKEYEFVLQPGESKTVEALNWLKQCSPGDPPAHPTGAALPVGSYSVYLEQHVQTGTTRDEATWEEVVIQGGPFTTTIN